MPSKLARLKNLISTSVIEIPSKLELGRTYAESIAFADNLAPQALVELATNYKFHQIVQASSTECDLELQTSAIMLEKPETFIEHPLSSILDPTKTDLMREQELKTFQRFFNQGSEKSKLLSELHDSIFSLSVTQSLNSEIKFAADELFTNAIYNAPHVKFLINGPGVPRDRHFGEASNIKKAEIFMGVSDSRIVIGCVDHYGTLNPDHLISVLFNCYKKGMSGAMNVGPGGAGLGTFMLFESALSIYVGVSQNRKSVVCCSFSREKRAKVRAELPKNLHFCRTA